MREHQIDKWKKGQTFAEMRIDTHIARGASKTLVVLEGDVLSRILINVLLGKPKIDHVDDAVAVVGLASNKKVLWFHIPVY